MTLLYLATQFQLFFLIMMRMFAMISVAPFFSSVMIPMRIKAALALTITIVIYPVLSQEMNLIVPEGLLDYGILVLNELIVGFSLGLMVSIIFGVFQLAGQFFSIQMGFGISEVFDPISQVHVPLVGQFLALFGTLIFLLVHGHFLLIEGVYQSFLKIPVLSITQSAKPLSDIMIEFFTGMFMVALKISLPMIGTLFIVTLCMGLLAKFAPQMNILMMGFPLYITIGFIMLTLLTPSIVQIGTAYLEFYFERIFRLF